MSTLGTSPHVPDAGFEVGVITDRPVYAAGDPVRITVTATNHGSRPLEQRFAGWQRFVTTVRDEFHRVVADDRVDRPAAEDALGRWLPGQMVLFPLYWGQNAGPLVPAWVDEPPGPRVEPGRYRVRVTWLGRMAGVRPDVDDVWSGWFELV